jgi:predicted transcriptional regulator
MKVQEIMTRDVFTLPAGARAGAAAWTLDAELVSGAPVVDREGKVVGVISKTNLMQLAQDGHHRPQAKVADGMSDRIWSVRPEDGVLDAVQLMVDKSVHRVLVVDSAGKLEGIVTPMDVMRALARGPLGPRE